MLNYAAYLAYIWQILRFVRRLLAYIWQVFVRKVSKTCPLSGFSRRACAIYERETSGQDAKSAIYRGSVQMNWVYVHKFRRLGCIKSSELVSMTIRGVKASLWARVRSLRCAELLTQRISQSQPGA